MCAYISTSSDTTALIGAVVFALLRVVDNHYVALFLDETMNAVYVPMLWTYTVLVLGVATLRGIESTLESGVLAVVLLMPLGCRIGMGLHEYYLRKVSCRCVCVCVCFQCYIKIIIISRGGLGV